MYLGVSRNDNYETRGKIDVKIALEIYFVLESAFEALKDDDFDNFAQERERATTDYIVRQVGVVGSDA